MTRLPFRASKRGRLALPALLAAALAVGACERNHDGDHGHDMHAEHATHAAAALPAGEPSGGSLYVVDRTWRDAADKAVRWPELAGKPRLVAMLYTSCEHVCPLIVEHMQTVERRLDDTARARLHATLVSFDPERDTPARLAAYAEQKKLDRNRWTLLTGAPGDTRELAALLGVQYRKLPDGEFAHSNTITLLDAAGNIVYQRKRLDEPLDALIAATQRLTAE